MCQISRKKKKKMKNSMEGTWLSQPLQGLRRLAGLPEGGRMSKARTIWVPRLRWMQQPAVCEDVASLLAALEQGLHEVGPRLQSTFSMLEWQTGQRRSTLFIIMVTLLCVYMVTSQNAPLVCNFIIYIIAAYSSFHNIESSTKNDDSRWIVFWIIFGLFGMMDHFTEQIWEHFPLFWLFKLLFLMWCLAPTSSNGVTTIYFHLLYPLFLGVNDPCTMVANFADGQQLCNRIWRRCYPWAPPPATDEEQLQDVGKDTSPPPKEPPPTDRKRAGDSKAKISTSTPAVPLDQAGTEGQKEKKVIPKKGQAAACDNKGPSKVAMNTSLEKGKKPGVTGSLSKAQSVSSPEKDKKQGVTSTPSKAKSVSSSETNKKLGVTSPPSQPQPVLPVEKDKKQGVTSAPTKAQSSTVTTKKPATSVRKPSLSSWKDELKPSGATSPAVPGQNRASPQATIKSASDSVIKSKTSTQDEIEDTYESHLSNKRGSKGMVSEGGAGMGSWNDISVFSKRGEDGGQRPLHCEERKGSMSLNKGSIPIIQPVVQPLFSLHSSPYSSTCGSAQNAPFHSQSSAGPYAFGPSYPSYHAGPFYHPGCLPPRLGYNRARMMLCGGPMQKQESLSAKNKFLLSPEESEGDSFIEETRPAGKAKGHDKAGSKPGQQKDSKSSSSKEEGKKDAVTKEEQNKKPRL